MNQHVNISQEQLHIDIRQYCAKAQKPTMFTAKKLPNPLHKQQHPKQFSCKKLEQMMRQKLKISTYSSNNITDQSTLRKTIVYRRLSNKHLITKGKIREMLLQTNKHQKDNHQAKKYQTSKLLASSDYDMFFNLDQKNSKTGKETLQNQERTHSSRYKKKQNAKSSTIISINNKKRVKFILKSNQIPISALLNEKKMHNYSASSQVLEDQPRKQDKNHIFNSVPANIREQQSYQSKVHEQDGRQREEMKLQLAIHNIIRNHAQNKYKQNKKQNKFSSLEGIIAKIQLEQPLKISSKKCLEREENKKFQFPIKSSRELIRNQCTSIVAPLTSNARKKSRKQQFPSQNKNIQSIEGWRQFVSSKIPDNPWNKEQNTEEEENFIEFTERSKSKKIGQSWL